MSTCVLITCRVCVDSVGLSGNICCPIVHWNTALNEYVMIYTEWGLNSVFFISSSKDGVSWGPVSAIFLSNL